MTKRELEIRLEIAERVIAESLFDLSEEGVQKIKSDFGWKKEDCVLGTITRAKYDLKFYSKRADEAVERNGRDIYCHEI